MATALGSLTVTDVSDGSPSISIFQTNENQTFTATSDGSVASSVLSEFFNDIIVLVADTQAAYIGSGTPTANNTYAVTRVDSTGVTSTLASNNQARVVGGGTIDVVRSQVTDYTGTADASITYTIVVRALNTNYTYTATASLSKAIGGSAESINVTANRQTFQYTGSESTTASLEGDITLTAAYDGPDTGTFTWTRDVVLRNGTVHATGEAVTGTTATQTVTAAIFNGAGATAGDVGSITYTVSRGMVTDRISIVRLNSGDNAFVVIPQVSAGSVNLKNNSGSVTLQMHVFEGADELSSLAGWSFTYEGPPANDHDGTREALTSADTGITLADFNGGTNAQITIAAEYIENDQAATITVTGSNS